MPGPEYNRDDAIREGVYAFHDGLKPHQNPHTYAALRDAWLKGYEHARAMRITQGRGYREEDGLLMATIYGIRAAKAGVPRTRCPYTGPDLVEAWDRAYDHQRSKMQD